MSTDTKPSGSGPIYEKALKLVATDRLATFHQLVREYKYLATVECGHSWVHYLILARLANAGWERSGKATAETEF